MTRASSPSQRMDRVSGKGLGSLLRNISLRNKPSLSPPVDDPPNPNLASDSSMDFEVTSYPAYLLVAFEAVR